MRAARLTAVAGSGLLVLVLACGKGEKVSFGEGMGTPPGLALRRALGRLERRHGHGDDLGPGQVLG